MVGHLQEPPSTTVTRTSAVRLGIPLRRIATRILLPIGLFLLLLAAGLSYREAGLLQRQMTADQRAGVRTIFETSSAVHAEHHGLSVLARNRGFERVWVLSATGDILDSSLPAEIGYPLESRWWDLVRNQSTGLHQEEIQFGDQRLMMTSLNSVEVGRHDVVVSRPISILPSWILIASIFLGVSLIFWVISSAIVIDTLQTSVSKPLRKIDERLYEFLRGGTIAPAALDRLLAETEKQLGGHSDTVVDLARMTSSRGLASNLSSRQFRTLFDIVPSWVLLRGPDGRILDCNDSLANGTGIDRQWISGRPLALLSDFLPVDRLDTWFANSASSKLGVRRLRIDNASVMGERHSLLMTINPFPMEGGMAHLIIMEDVTVLEQVVTNGSGDRSEAAGASGLGGSDSFGTEYDNLPNDPTLFDEMATKATTMEPSPASAAATSSSATPASAAADYRAPDFAATPAESVSMVPDAILALFRGEDFSGDEQSALELDSLALEGMSHLSGDGAHLIPTLEVSEQPDKSAPNQAKVDASEDAPKSASSNDSPSASKSASSNDSPSAPKSASSNDSPSAPQPATQPTPSSDKKKIALADQVLHAMGHIAVAFNEEGQTIYWSPAGKELTGHEQEEIGDLQRFTKLIFPHSKERKLFMQWLDSDPDERSQELKVRTKDGIVPARWHASEIETADSGPVGVLWAAFTGVLTSKASGKGEPPLQEMDS